MKLVISGDWHLARRTWASLPAVEGDAYKSASQIFAHCLSLKERGEDVNLVLAGDVFDTVSPTPDAVAFFLRGVERLEKANVAVYAIQGQHGRYDDLPWPSVHPCVKNLAQAPVRLLPDKTCGLVGFDSSSPAVLQDKLKELSKDVRVLIMHQMLRGLVPDVDGHQNWDLDPEWVPAHVKHVFLGDYHKPVTVRSNHGSEFVYTGSINMQAVDEPQEKSFIEFDTVTGKWKRVPLKTRPFASYACREAERLAEILTKIGALEPDTLVLLKYDPRVPEVEKRAKEANPRAHFMLRVLPIDEPAGGVAAELPTQVSLEGCLDVLVKRDREPKLHSFLLLLLRAENPPEAIGQLRAQYVKEQA